MIREPRERGVEGQMREAARIDNFVAMDVSVPFRAQDISRTWFDKHLSRIRYFHVNKRWTFLRRNSFFPLPSPPPLSRLHPPPPSAPLWREQKDRLTGSMFQPRRGQWIHLAVDDYPLRIGVQPCTRATEMFAFTVARVLRWKLSERGISKRQTDVCPSTAPDIYIYIYIYMCVELPSIQFHWPSNLSIFA